MSLALSTLIYEWRRYLAAVIALAFSGLLILAQVGMFAGIGKAFTANISRSPAEIMILAPKAESLMNEAAGVPRRLMPQVYLHPEVVQVRDLAATGGMWQNFPEGDAKRKREFVSVSIVDPVPGAVTLPIDYTEEWRLALAQPYAVAADETALGRLGVKLGDKAQLNGRTVYVRAVIKGYPNMMNPTVVMSRDTMRLLGFRRGANDRAGPLMVKIADPARAETVRAHLNESMDGQARAWTRAELAKANENAMFKEQIIGVMLGFSVFLGIVIGTAITSQTLRGAILASIKEFASLRALGVSMGSLRLIVIELAFWVGMAGLVTTGLLVLGVSALADRAGVPMAFSPTVIFPVAILLVVISMVSGLLALGILKKSQPADLLR
jgi:putative ABC transport system permease protein